VIWRRFGSAGEDERQVEDDGKEQIEAVSCWCSMVYRRRVWWKSWGSIEEGEKCHQIRQQSPALGSRDETRMGEGPPMTDSPTRGPCPPDAETGFC